MAQAVPDSISVLEQNDLFFQRESGQTHTPYETERLFYGCVGSGDVEQVQTLMTTLLQQTVVAGRLSDDPVRQMQYWAICCITLATRSAVQGGLDETTAYNLSDESIRQIDQMRDPQEMLQFLQTLCVRFTAMVRDSRTVQDAPAAVRKCLHIIETDLHGRLTAASLAQACALSPDYLCALFKKHVGMPLNAYIRRRRLFAARDLLRTDKTLSEIAYDLGFCSESYFIRCYHQQFGETPRHAREHQKMLFAPSESGGTPA